MNSGEKHIGNDMKQRSPVDLEQGNLGSVSLRGFWESVGVDLDPLGGCEVMKMLYILELKASIWYTLKLDLKELCALVNNYLLL